jgi:hypothetical protein
MATESLVAVIKPIYEKRMELENAIDQTWEMLRDQSVKASKRAEQTMVEVREIFDLSHDLGSVRRYFGITAVDLRNAHDLSQIFDLACLEQDERAEMLRDHWRDNIVPRDVVLQGGGTAFTTLERELEEPLLSAKKKRILTAISKDDRKSEEWNFAVAAKSYEVWVLLCFRKDDAWLQDFVVPQKYYSQAFAQAKKSLKKDEKIPVTVRKDGDRFLLSIHGSAPVDITDLESNYEPLQ